MERNMRLKRAGKQGPLNCSGGQFEQNEDGTYDVPDEVGQHLLDNIPGWEEVEYGEGYPKVSSGKKKKRKKKKKVVGKGKKKKSKKKRLTSDFDE